MRVSTTCLWGHTLVYARSCGDRCGTAGEWVALKAGLVDVGTRLSAVPRRTTGGCVVTG